MKADGGNKMNSKNENIKPAVDPIHAIFATAQKRWKEEDSGYDLPNEMIRHYRDWCNYKEKEVDPKIKKLRRKKKYREANSYQRKKIRDSIIKSGWIFYWSDEGIDVLEEGDQKEDELISWVKETPGNTFTKHWKQALEKELKITSRNKIIKQVKKNDTLIISLLCALGYLSTKSDSSIKEFSDLSVEAQNYIDNRFSVYDISGEMAFDSDIFADAAKELSSEDLITFLKEKHISHIYSQSEHPQMANNLNNIFLEDGSLNIARGADIAEYNEINEAYIDQVIDAFDIANLGEVELASVIGGSFEFLGNDFVELLTSLNPFDLT